MVKLIVAEGAGVVNHSASNISQLLSAYSRKVAIKTLQFKTILPHMTNPAVFAHIAPILHGKLRFAQKELPWCREWKLKKERAI